MSEAFDAALRAASMSPRAVARAALHRARTAHQRAENMSGAAVEQEEVRVARDYELDLAKTAALVSIADNLEMIAERMRHG